MGKNNLTERLMDLKERIDDARTAKAEMEGRKKSIKDALLKKYDCATIEGAESLLKSKKNERAKKLNILQKGIEELEAEFE